MFNYTLSLSHWSNQLRARRQQPHQWATQLRFLCADAELPWFVRTCPTTMSCLSWLRQIDWSQLDQSPQSGYLQQVKVPRATYVAAYLVKLDQHVLTMGRLRKFLIHHPALIWALGFPLVPGKTVVGFAPELSLPSRRQFSRVLSTLPNEMLQRLLDSQVTQLQSLLPDSFGHTISLDTKHILSWLKENNPKAFIKEGRFDKTRQPSGDPDCKLGCKRRRNIVTPTKEGQPGRQKRSVGEFYWGYASGAVVTKVPGFGEFVLAELTQTFDKGDTLYFFPLMEMTERRLGLSQLMAH